jgi:hypothetical protein
MTTAKLRNSTGNSVKISGGKSVTRYKPDREVSGSRSDVGHDLSPFQTQRLDNPIRHLPSIPRRIIEALGQLLRIIEAMLHVVGLALFLATGLTKQQSCRGNMRNSYLGKVESSS